MEIINTHKVNSTENSGFLTLQYPSFIHSPLLCDPHGDAPGFHHIFPGAIRTPCGIIHKSNKNRLESGFCANLGGCRCHI